MCLKTSFESVHILDQPQFFVRVARLVRKNGGRTAQGCGGEQLVAVGGRKGAARHI